MENRILNQIVVDHGDKWEIGSIEDESHDNLEREGDPWANLVLVVLIHSEPLCLMAREVWQDLEGLGLLSCILIQRDLLAR